MFVGTVQLALPLAFHTLFARSSPDIDTAFSFSSVITARQPVDKKSIDCSPLANEYLEHDKTLNSTLRQMVIFRAPSRHTFGFIDDTVYDLPEIELRNLLCSALPSEHLDIHFRSVVNSTTDDSPYIGNNVLPKIRKNARKQNKLKSIQCTNSVHQNKDLLRWVCCTKKITDDDLARTTSRAVLTHAAFSIVEQLQVTDDEWQDATKQSSHFDNHLQSLAQLPEEMDVIDMDNPNMSQCNRKQLIQQIACILKRNQGLLHKLQPYILASFSPGSVRCTTQSQQLILIYHKFVKPKHLVVPRSEANHDSLTEFTCHHILFGRRLAIGLAGTLGAPSKTLRRPQRGILKDYSLKNRRLSNTDNLNIISTAMEPEIGFLMVNLLASAGNKSNRANRVRGLRVLDPCCGSGRLLLYAAALGATQLTGSDSDTIEWKDAIIDFENHRTVGTSTISPLPVPAFFNGDVHFPLLTKVLCTPNSVDAVICDPPYNIGAPVLVNGKDTRPWNYHHEEERKTYTSDKSDIQTWEAFATTRDIITSIIAIAQNVLIDRGRIVFFLPVRGSEMALSLEEILSNKGWLGCKKNDDSEGNPACHLQLLKHLSRKQAFSHTFCRWLVCMEKIVDAQ